jgi:signal transduction histidine kinase
MKTPAFSSKPWFPYTASALALGLFASHILAAGLVLWLARPAGSWLALLLAGLLGLLLHLPQLRALAAVQQGLVELSQGRPPHGLNRWAPGLLDGLAVHVWAVSDWLHQAQAERAAWLEQARQGAAQAERHRLARDLHDSIKQQLFSIQMSASALERSLEAPPARARAALADLRQAAQAALVEMNALLQQLVPAPLERAGLVEALRLQCEALGHRAGIAVSAEFGPLPPPEALPPAAAESLFRIAQEALSNIARHARASSAQLYLGQRRPDGPLLLEISDDGQGYDPSGLAQSPTGGQGLHNLRQRAAALNAVLELHSAPQQGACLRLILPVREVHLEETMKTDFTFHKLTLVGLLGGLALLVALYLPLYAWLPTAYFPAWEAEAPTSPLPVLGLSLLAALVALMTGLTAAWWANSGSRSANLLRGAFSGALAGALLFFALAGSASAVVGHALLLEHGAVYDPDMLVPLLAASVSAGVHWAYLSFWLCLLSGAGLGALGGALSPLRAVRPTHPYLGWLFWQGLALGGAFALLLHLLMFTLLQPQAAHSLAESGYPYTELQAPPLAAISLWPVATGEILFFAPLIGLFLLLRRDLASADPQRLQAVPGRAWFAIPLLLLLSLAQVSNSLPLRPDYSAGLLSLAGGGIGLLLAAAFFSLALQAEKKTRLLGLPLAPERHFNRVALLAGLLSAGLFAAFSPAPIFVLLVFVFGWLGTLGLLRFRRGLPLFAWNAPDERQRHEHFSAGLPAFLAATLAAQMTLPVSLGIILIPVTMIASLSSPDAEAVDLVANVQVLYNLNAAGTVLLLVVAAVASGLSLLVLSLVRRRQPVVTGTIQS